MENSIKACSVHFQTGVKEVCLKSAGKKQRKVISQPSTTPGDPAEAFLLKLVREISWHILGVNWSLLRHTNANVND